MCDDTIVNEEKECFLETIKSIKKSIEKGEAKLRSVFKKDKPNETKRKI